VGHSKMEIRLISTHGYQLWTCDTTTSGIGGYGSIQLEYGWQLVAVPIVSGFWSTIEHKHIHDDITIAKFKNYVLDQITDLYGSGVVEVANTYLGDNQFFWNYVPGSTPETSNHNFKLVYNDSGYFEISGFWLKSLSMIPIVITWGEQ
jgi:hypothetical protein